METKITERTFWLAAGQSFPSEKEALEWLINFYPGIPASHLKTMITREVMKIRVS